MQLKKCLMFSIIAPFLLLSVTGFADARDQFQVGAWFYDPYQVAYESSEPCTSRSLRRQHVDAAYDQMLDWCEAMQLTWICLEKPDSFAFQKLNQRAGRIKGFNVKGVPAFADTYARAQGQSMIALQDIDWYYWDRGRCIPGAAVDTVSRAGEQVHRIGPGNPDTLWRPEFCGRWYGWGNSYMPLRFRITCGADINVGVVGEYPKLASIYWLVQDNVSESYEDRSGTWTRYPALVIPADTLLFPAGAQTLITIEAAIRPDTGNFRKLDNLFRDIDSAGSSHRFPANSLRNARLFVAYEGGHTFYLHKIEVMDERYWRLIYDANNESLLDSLGNAFRIEYQANQPSHAGWFDDDSNHQFARPRARVFMAMEDAGVPLMPISSFNDQPQKFFQYLHEFGMRPQIQCNESYWFGADSTCRPHYATMSPNTCLLTATASDSNYFVVDSTAISCPSCNFPRYNGIQSLQHALDAGIWGPKPFIVPRSQGTWTEKYNIGLLRQTQIVHAYGAEMWPFLLSGSFSNTDSEACDYAHPWRNPTPIEMRLQIWMAVACDVDGIMWYGLLENTLTNQWGLRGLFEWEPGNGFCNGPRAIDTTERYTPAKDALEKVFRIWPTLEPLRFKRSYASSTFLHRYAANDSDWVRRDTLYQSGTFKSTVDSIWSYAPSFLPPPTLSEVVWQAEPEDRSYVQISRFQMPGAPAEDYWFLVVNRRALAHEVRRIRIGIDSVLYPSQPYLAEHLLADQRNVTGHFNNGAGRVISVDLAPGDAEFIHFSRLDTTDMIITADTVLKAPCHYAKNIIIRGATVTIEPDLDALRDSIIVNGRQHARYDSIAAMTFWGGKGIKVESGTGSNVLRVLGNDSINIRFQAATANQKWAGIHFNAGDRDTLNLQYVELRSAMTGVNWHAGQYADSGQINLRNCVFRENTCALTAGGPARFDFDKCAIDSCEFRGCATGLMLTTQARAEVRNTVFAENATAVSCGTGSRITLGSCLIEDNTQWAVNVWGRAHADFDNTIIRRNGFDASPVNAAVRVTARSTATFRRCELTENKGPAIYGLSSTIVLADPDTTAPLRWGCNRIENNQTRLSEVRSEIVESNSTLLLDKGRNKIVSTQEDPRFIGSPPRSGCVRYWRDNYWGTTDTSFIRSRLPSDVVFWPHLTTWGSCYATPVPDTVNNAEAKLAQGVGYIDASEYAAAAETLKVVIQASLACRPALSAIDALLTADLLAGEPDRSFDYYGSLVDTVSATETRLAAYYAMSGALAYSGEMDRAEAVVTTLLDSAQSNEDKVVARISLLSLDLMRMNLDSDTVVTADFLQSVIDSVNHLIASLSVWTQYLITDSVVMYAPCRVDSQIYIDNSGVLTILPTPGIAKPTVNFRGAGGIFVDGYPPSFPENEPPGKLYVLGESDNPVTLAWDSSDVRMWGDIYSLKGVVVLKHAKLTGGNWMNVNEQVSHERKPVLLADSCIFETFDFGLCGWNMDTSSHIRHCTFRNLGANPVPYIGMEFGIALTIVESTGLLVEGCVFENNIDVGILNCMSSNTRVRNTSITNNGAYGILVWGGDMELDCIAATRNGDTLPEIWVDDGLIDFVGSHSELADSFGTLVYSADPSFIDLEEGENAFCLWSGNGLYLKSGDTTVAWDITWNNWSPSTPMDPDFFDYLYPHTPAKWTVDSSLASFVACGQAGAMGFNDDRWLIVGSSEQGGIYSHNGERDGHTIAEQPDKSIVVKHDVQEKREVSNDFTLAKSDKRMATRKSVNRDQAIRLHHEELAKWREFNNTAKSGSRQPDQELGMRFVIEHPSSSFMPAVLVKLAALADQKNTSVRISDFLKQQTKSLPREKDRTLARRLSNKALAMEGHPAEALAGLETMMETAQTPHDSIRALVDAMGVYFFNRGMGNLQPKYTQVRNDDIRQFAKRIVGLARILDDPNLGSVGQGVPIPQVYKLYQNFPNPFNPTTEIRFDLPEAIRVELKIFNILGQEVAKLVDDVRPAGAYRVLWDSKSTSDISVASGVYIYQIKAGSFVDAKKMVLIR